MHIIERLPHSSRKQTCTFHASLTEEYPQWDVITSELGTCVIVFIFMFLGCVRMHTLCILFCYYGFFIVTYFLHDAHRWRSSLYYLHTTILWILLIQIRRTLCLFKFLCNFKSVFWVLLNVKRNTWLQTVKKYGNQLQHKFYKFRNLHTYWYSLSMNDYDQLVFFCVAFY